MKWQQQTPCHTTQQCLCALAASSAFCAHHSAAVLAAQLASTKKLGFRLFTHNNCPGCCLATQPFCPLPIGHSVFPMFLALCLAHNRLWQRVGFRTQQCCIAVPALPAKGSCIFAHRVCATCSTSTAQYLGKASSRTRCNSTASLFLSALAITKSRRSRFCCASPHHMHIAWDYFSFHWHVL